MHLYDLYKLNSKMKMDGDLSELIEKVRKERRKVKNCLSAQEGCSVNSILGEIIKKDFYKKDYEEKKEIYYLKKLVLMWL